MKVRWILGGMTLSVALVQVPGSASYRSRPPAFADDDARVTGTRALPPPFRAGQFGGGFGGGFGRGQQPDVPLTDQFDADDNGRLDATERQAALEYAEANGFNRGRGGRRGVAAVQPTAGIRVTPADVRPYPTTPLFDLATVRTLFLDFENDGWERELMAFKPTDVEVPATLVVDGREYRDVGVQYRGNSSFSGVPAGLKHSISLNINWIHDGQAVQGFSNLTLLNAHEDASFLRTVLTMQIAREYLPAPRANFVRVVINGEDWGVFVNQQHFNKDLLEDAFGTDAGTRWKVPGSPGRSSGGLAYLGADTAAYRRAFEIKSADEPDAWDALIELTRVLDQTPAADVEAAVARHLDIDSTLRFLALDNALVNEDGYWTRGSDYNLYLHPDGRFRILPYDVNSTFSTGAGGGFGRRAGGSPDLDPLHAANDPTKPLVSKLLSVPALRTQYLKYVRDIATTWLAWDRLGPIVERHHALIAPLVEIDTRKLESLGAFEASIEELRAFAERRRDVLLAATASVAAR